MWKGCHLDRTPAGKNIPHYQRTVFRRLMRFLEPGDHLVVWQLEHIDANPYALTKALGSLARRQVYVHALRFQRHELELDPQVGRVFAEMMVAIIEMFNAHRRDSVKRALRAKSRVGGAVGRYPPLGKKRVTVRGDKVDIWSDTELSTIQEIYIRRRRGESFEQIGQDLYQRRVKTASGRLWAKPKGRQGGLELNRLRRAYARWPEIQAELPFLTSAKSEAGDGEPESVQRGAR